MCFSATASFGAGAILTVIGFASLKKTNQLSERLFAGIPCLFGVQQFSEGILWLTLPTSSYPILEKLSTAVFIVIAQIVWPIWVPLAMHQIEKNPHIRQALSFLVGIGILFSVCLAWCLITYGVQAKIDGNHISYIETYPDFFGNLGGYLYVLVTVFSPLISSYKRMWLLGFAIILSYTITKVYYDNYLISVWCFFAAVISMIVYLVIPEIKSRRVQIVEVK